MLVTDELGIAPHVVLLTLAFGFGVLFYRRAHATLRGQARPTGRVAGLVLPILVLAASFGVSVFATYELRRTTKDWHLKFKDAAVTASDEDLEKEGAIDKLKLLDLQRVKLRHADGRNAILVKGDFRGVDLSDANFEDADLRYANLQDTILTDTKFARAKLKGAVFGGAKLNRTDFTGVKPALSAAMLAGACGAGRSVSAFVKPCEAPPAQVASADELAPGSEKPEVRPEPEPVPQPVKPAVRPEPEPVPPQEKPAVRPEPKPVVDSRRGGETFRDCPECPEMVVIPAGGFVMGSPEDETGRLANEGPQHGVKIAEPFAVGKYEVTRGEFAAFMKAAGHDIGNSCWTDEKNEWKDRPDRGWRDPVFSQTDRDPVVCVNWNDAKAYVKWLSEKTKYSYRILSEAQWEYVARAGTTTKRYWGDADDGCDYANAADLTAKVKNSGWTTSNCTDRFVNTAPGGSFQANAFGLHDVLGNVWEWVEDCWHESYKGALTDGSAWTSGKDCSDRVLRGGSWDSRPRFVRSAIRFRSGTTSRVNYSGFRVSRTLSQ